MGVGDQVPAGDRAARRRSVDADRPGELASGDLSRYNVIVTGVRAYERRPDLRANNQRLLEYAENGGTVIVQYNKFEFNEAQYGPYPAKVERGPRHRRERADRGPRAGPSGVQHAQQDRTRDLAGWVQERGTYFLGERDPRYVDLAALAAIRSRTTPAQRPARWSRRASARGGGSTSASACGGSCPRAPTARTV